MRASEAITKMNQAYLPGCAQFYDQFTPDPWQQANDRLEAVLLEGGSLINHPACEHWLNDMIFLIDKYREFNQRGFQVRDVRDNLHMFDPTPMTAELDVERTRKAQSRRHKECFVCEGSTDLVLHSENDTSEVAVICKPCKAKRQPRRT